MPFEGCWEAWGASAFFHSSDSMASPEARAAETIRDSTMDSHADSTGNRHEFQPQRLHRSEHLGFPSYCGFDAVFDLVYDYLKFNPSFVALNVLT